MVDVIGRAKVIITGDVDPRSIDKAGGKIGSVLKAGATVGVAALGTLAVAGVKAYQSFEEAEAQSRKLTQVLDNMGKSQAAPAVEKLADELSRLTGVDDDVIKQGETLLATFSQVAESAGETGGVFERATKASVDLAATGFGSVSSASVQLGKALQDPEKGITALNRAGVTFTASQKEQIRNFVEANDLAAAQAIILAEVEKQVGGTAEANATETMKITAAWGEVEENVGGIVADLIDALVGDGKGKKKSLSGSIRDVSDGVEDFAKSKSWKQLQGQISETSELIQSMVGPISKVVGWMEDLEEASPRLADTIKNLVDPLFVVKSAFGSVGAAIEEVIRLYNEAKDAISNVPFLGRFADDNGRASGGPARGLTLVGENGPELAQFGGSGGYVYNNSQTRDILGQTAAASVTNINNFYGPENLAEARRNTDWQTKWGTRFGASTSAGAL